MSFNEWLFFARRKFVKWLADLNPLNLFNRIDIDTVFEGMFHQRLTGLLPVIGYGLFLASLGDYAFILFPLQLQNPTWELQTFGALVEQSWGFLISLALIFSRYLTDNQNDIRQIELLALRLIRWILFLMALSFILATPLIVVDTHRVYRSINQQVSREDQVKLAQLVDINGKLERITDLNQMAAVGNVLGLNPNDLQNRSLADARKTIQDRLTTLKTEINTQIRNTRREQTQKLFKSSLRTLYTGLIICFIFIFIWFKIGTLKDTL
jgi:hypothetical protein